MAGKVHRASFRRRLAAVGWSNMPTMGYRVRSFLSVCSQDDHEHFLYYLPSRKLAYHWVTEWIDGHFDVLAKQLGPRAVIITAPVGVEDEFRQSADSLLLQESVRENYFEDNGSDVLHGGLPLLLIARTPIRPDVDRRDTVDCVAINLAAYEKSQIPVLFDRLIEAMQNGEDPHEVIPVGGEEHEFDRLQDYLSVFELKPSVFGLGINANAVLDLVRKRRKQRGGGP